nr:U-box domain-containing protein 12 [Ipomoea batatas]GME20423.1 U-box domain-containing protein 12 [Ipomoea batatas]
MGKCHLGNDVGSVVFDRPAPAAASNGGYSHLKLWSTSFRRMILDAVRCGGGGGGGAVRQKHADAASKSTMERKPSRRHQSQRSECGSKFSGSDKLSHLLRLSENSEQEEETEEVRRKVEALERLKGVTKRLQSSEADGVLEGAKEVRMLTKDDSEARATLALLGAIPPLVALLDAADSASHIAALYALLNLAIGNDANKAAIVKAGAVHKMLMLIESPNGFPEPAVVEAIVANFLGLSALDANKPIIGSSGAISFLLKILKDLDEMHGYQARLDSLRALYNLSISPSNIFQILETDLVLFLMSKLGDMEVSDRMLSILTNIVPIGEGRKAISVVPDAFPILVDVLNWTDSPGCQEKASYILMVMAHKSYADRQAMLETGIVSSLLELTLLGSTLAQKRASRLLECLRVDKGKQVSESFGDVSATLSAPQTSACSSRQLRDTLEEENSMMSEEKKAVKQLVQQSLQHNMKKIVKRANLPQDFVPSDHFKTLTSSSTSKSLPF